MGRCEPKGLAWSSEQLAALLDARTDVVGFTAQEPSSTVNRPGRLTENRIFDWLETQLRSPRNQAPDGSPTRKAAPGFSVTLMDASPDLLAIARRRCPTGSARLSDLCTMSAPATMTSSPVVASSTTCYGRPPRRYPLMVTRASARDHADGKRPACRSRGVRSPTCTTTRPSR